MNIRVIWLGQARAATGRSTDDIECDPVTTVEQALLALAEKHGGDLRRILLDESGTLHTSVMLFVNDEQVLQGQSHVLFDGDELTVMPPISGG